MAEITAALVKELRDKTNAGMMECKNALKETSGDVDAAIKFLRERGAIKAAKKVAVSTEPKKISEKREEKDKTKTVAELDRDKL